MRILSKQRDNRVDALNFLIEMKVFEYLKIAKEILDKNEFQRKRVKSSSTVYALLKEDLKLGCIIPPIVLAIDTTMSLDDVDEKKFEDEVNKGNLLILDGLQRTYTLIDLEKELMEKNDEDTLKIFNNQLIRIEIYAGLNRMKILYRMLTLNTGQTPVSLRHQVEILYIDYLNAEVEGNIKLIRDIEDIPINKLGNYSFKDTVEGFNSYLERSEFPLDKFDLLENIKSLDKLSKETQNTDLFEEFIKIYNKFVLKIDNLSNSWKYDDEKISLNLNKPLKSEPFGKSIPKIFAKSQPMTGFGSALGRLKDYNLISGFNNISDFIDDLQSEDMEKFFAELLKKLDEIKSTSKKIGNSQRLFFHYFFRELFNHDGDSYLDLNKAIENGFRKYLSQTV